MPDQEHTTTDALLPEQVLVAVFRERNLKLALAESCTGGMIAARITSVPGASDIFKGGVVCYANEVKRDLLGVPQGILETEGAVSASCAKAMAEGARRALQRVTSRYPSRVLQALAGGPPQNPSDASLLASQPKVQSLQNDTSSRATAPPSANRPPTPPCVSHLKACSRRTAPLCPKGAT